jgi:hypothetical protein
LDLGALSFLRDDGRVRLLDGVVERWTLVENLGRSGAQLERAVLRDGSRVVIKHMTPANDFTMKLVGETEARGTDSGRQECWTDCPVRSGTVCSTPSSPTARP